MSDSAEIQPLTQDFGELFGPEELSPKQKKFIREYLKDHSGANAWIRAGYSENGASQSASRLLSQANAQAYLKQRLKLIESMDSVTDDYVVGGIVDLTERCVPNLKNAKDALKGYELLAKYRKLLTDKQEVTGASGGPLQLVHSVPRPVRPGLPKESGE